jgi:hypothetical protein
MASFAVGLGPMEFLEKMQRALDLYKDYDGFLRDSNKT